MTAGAGTGGGETVSVSKSELDNIRRTIAEQETLIGGYQKENEKLLEVQKVMKETFLREKGEILQEVSELSEHFGRRIHHTNSAQREAVNRRSNKFENAYALVSSSVSMSVANLALRGSSAATATGGEENVDPKKLNGEIQELKSALQANDSRNLELQHEITKLRKEKKDNMLAAEGLSTRKLANSDRDVNTLKGKSKYSLV